MRQNTTLYLGYTQLHTLAAESVHFSHAIVTALWRSRTYALARSNSGETAGPVVAPTACEEGQAMSEAQVIIFPGVRAEQRAVNLAMQRSFQGAIGQNVMELRQVRLNRAFLKLNRLLTDDRRALPGARG